MTTRSVDVVREFIARLDSGAPAWSLLTPDAVVTVNGTTPLSGRYTGLEMVRGILVDTARSVVDALEVGIDELLCSGERVAALLKVSGRSRSGVTFNSEGKACGCVFGVRDGLIDEILFYPDTSLIEIALYGRRFVPDA